MMELKGKSPTGIVERIDLRIEKNEGVLKINIQCPKCKCRCVAFWEFKKEDSEVELLPQEKEKT